MERIINQQAAEELATICASLKPSTREKPAEIGDGMLNNIILLAQRALGVEE